MEPKWLLAVRYEDERQRKAMEYIAATRGKEYGLGKPEGVAYTVSQGDVEELVREFTAKVGPRQIQLYRLEALALPVKADLKPIHFTTRLEPGILRSMIAKLLQARKGVRADAPTDRTEMWTVSANKGRAMVHVEIKPGTKTSVTLTIEAVEPAFSHFYKDIQEAVDLLKV